MSAVRLFFFSKRKDDRVKRIERIIQVLFQNLGLEALAIGFVTHDLLLFVVHFGIICFVVGGVLIDLRSCGLLIHREGRSSHAADSAAATATATTDTQ